MVLSNIFIGIIVCLIIILVIMIGLLMKTAHDMIDVAVKSNVDLIITKMDKEEVTE